MRGEAANLFRTVQNEICSALERFEVSARFGVDEWTREDLGGGHGGGGITRIISGGEVLEKGAVNFSEVRGTLPREMTHKLTGLDESTPFYATGVSLIMHPRSPMVPTTHANFRYLEVGSLSWFGGGADLTPYYLFEEDAAHFHRVLKEVCDRHDQRFYPEYKKWCDEYFYLPHRGEARGIGGIFYDYLGKGEPTRMKHLFKFQSEIARSFVPAYAPIVEKRRALSWTDAQKEFQLLRRGRYVEFNLLYDRGTQFGLKTGGRTESILASLPPEVHWAYDYSPPVGTEEARLVETLRSPREWV